MTLCIDGTEAHHIRYERPKGPMSRGICKRCGRVVEGRNSVDNKYQGHTLIVLGPPSEELDGMSESRLKGKAKIGWHGTIESESSPLRENSNWSSH